MTKDTMITLDNGKKYVLLDETIIEDEKYFFAVRVDENTEEPTQEYEVFQEVIEDGEKFIDILENDDFKQAVLLDFTSNYMETVQDMIDDQE